MKAISGLFGVDDGVGTKMGLGSEVKRAEGTLAADGSTVVEDVAG